MHSYCECTTLVVYRRNESKDLLSLSEDLRKEARDVTAINRHAAQLNVEVSDVLSFQPNSAEE